MITNDAVIRDELKPDILVAAYASGIFPMADRDGTIAWYRPDPRAVIPFDGLKISRSLRTAARRHGFTTHVNRAFEQVIRACAERPEGTWISSDIIEAYCELHRLGLAHSVETWQSDRLVGGLYGVALGGAFFGESMFHRVTDASKVALVALVERLRDRGFTLLDTQFMTPHLRSLGAIEIPRREYERRLRHALRAGARPFGD